MQRLKLTIFLVLALSLGLKAQDANELYIAKYSDMAVEEMYRSGVPASITLAQGILESGSGTSTLAVNANNHFGIKCHSWDGEKTYHDDDRPQECFRKYDSAADSFKDHSDFLRYHDRYKFLFDLEPTDYKGWAYGLKKAGYATSPTYAEKLISLIERYDLSEYDTVELLVLETETASAGKKESSESEGTLVKRGRPASPAQMESLSPAEGFTFSLSRQVFEKNGVACVMALEGETYSSIAAEYDLFLREILKYNDVSEDETLQPGQLVYIRAKKNQTEKGLDKHIVESEDETLWKIAQRYGVKLKSLLKMNSFKGDEELVEDMVILLRKEK